MTFNRFRCAISLVWVIGVGSCNCVAQSIPTIAAFGGSFVWDRHGPKVVHVQTVAKLHNGQDEVLSGSGVRVGPLLVLTAKHNVPTPDKYRAERIEIRFGGPDSSPVRATLLEMDATLDLALLVVNDQPEVPLIDGCPTFAVNAISVVRPGRDLFILGYPLDGALSLSRGILSTQPKPDAKVWDTDADMNPGASGGPVFTEQGYFLGVALRGVTTWKPTTGVAVDVQGVKRFVPATKIVDSSIGKQILATGPTPRCFRSVPTNADLTYGLSSAFGPIPKPLSELGTQHSLADGWSVDGVRRLYVKTILAENGYSIQSCKFDAWATLDANSKCDVSANKRTATVSVPVSRESQTSPNMPARAVLRQRLASRS